MISLLSEGLSSVFNTTVQKHQFFSTQPFYCAAWQTHQISLRPPPTLPTIPLLHRYHFWIPGLYHQTGKTPTTYLEVFLLFFFFFFSPKSSLDGQERTAFRTCFCYPGLSEPCLAFQLRCGRCEMTPQLPCHELLTLDLLQLHSGRMPGTHALYRSSGRI